MAVRRVEVIKTDWSSVCICGSSAYLCSLIINLGKDPIVWLEGARPVDTCNPAFFGWMALKYNVPYSPPKTFWLAKAFLSGEHVTWCASSIHPDGNVIQVLTGLALSSQTVACLFGVIREQVKWS